MIYQDNELFCIACRQTFVFSSEEQKFFAARELLSEPRRCLNCRMRAKMERNGIDSTRFTQMVCDGCRIITGVPFKPKGICALALASNWYIL